MRIFAPLATAVLVSLSAYADLGPASSNLPVMNLPVSTVPGEPQTLISFVPAVLPPSAEGPAFVMSVFDPVARKVVLRIGLPAKPSFFVWNADGSKLFYRLDRTVYEMDWKAGAVAKEAFQVPDTVDPDDSSSPFVDSNRQMLFDMWIQKDSGLWMISTVQGRGPVNFMMRYLERKPDGTWNEVASSKTRYCYSESLACGKELVRLKSPVPWVRLHEPRKLSPIEDEIIRVLEEAKRDSDLVRVIFEWGQDKPKIQANLGFVLYNEEFSSGILPPLTWISADGKQRRNLVEGGEGSNLSMSAHRNWLLVTGTAGDGKLFDLNTGEALSLPDFPDPQEWAPGLR